MRNYLIMGLPCGRCFHRPRDLTMLLPMVGENTDHVLCLLMVR